MSLTNVRLDSFLLETGSSGQETFLILLAKAGIRYPIGVFKEFASHLRKGSR